jgi:hypothetical protein
VAKRKVRVRRTRTLRLKLTPQAAASLAGRAPVRLRASLRGARVTVRQTRS